MPPAKSHERTFASKRSSFLPWGGQASGYCGGQHRLGADPQLHGDRRYGELASRLEGANRTYGTRVLISEATARLAADMLETREIHTVVAVGKTEPQRIFELLGRKGEVARERLALHDAYVEALEAYRSEDWEKALAGFEDCLAIVPCDAPSKLFVERIAQFRRPTPAEPPTRFCLSIYRKRQVRSASLYLQSPRLGPTT
jgi:hypothetical protein